ncbi:MAG: AAA-like domain-containing protein [Rivularia sp. (in: cyanobacteria)]
MMQPLESDLSWEASKDFVDEVVYQNVGLHLKDIEIIVLQSSWEGITYPKMAEDYGYSAEYLNKDVGNKLWNKLSQALGEKVTKHNFKEALRRAWKNRIKMFNNTPENNKFELLPLDSIYIERFPVEKRCFTEIMQPGCLLRIKAPLQTGKTELMCKILDYATKQEYRTVELNLRDATTEDFSSLNQFLQWFCTSITEILQLDYSIAEHWRKSLGNSKIKCRTYFEKYLLLSENPLVLALDEVDKIFAYPEIAGEFLGMLRTWHEDAKTRPKWKQLRILVLHTQAYTQLDINQSPFNAGTEMTLPDFTLEQVLFLAKQYDLNWDTNEVMQLMSMVGGHPYLVREAIKYVARKDMSLIEVLETASTAWGIYRYHLQKHSSNLSIDSQLTAAFNKVVLAESPVEFDFKLNQDTAVKLNDLGLVKLSINSAVPRYELYRLYFRQRCQNEYVPVQN